MNNKRYIEYVYISTNEYNNMVKMFIQTPNIESDRQKTSQINEQKKVEFGSKKPTFMYWQIINKARV